MSRPNKHTFRYKYVGRASKLTPDVVTKLEEASAIRATIQEACYYADISRNTYYRWMEENPELSDRLDALRQKAFLKARQTIISHLDEVNTAFRFLEKEKPDDYAERLKVEHIDSGIDGSNHKEDMEAIEQLHRTIKENRIKRSRERARVEGELIE